jgi:hypothetical protein
MAGSITSGGGSSGLDDSDPADKARLRLYVDMMNKAGYHHRLDHVIAAAPERVSRNIFDLDFPH